MTFPLMPFAGQGGGVSGRTWTAISSAAATGRNLRQVGVTATGTFFASMVSAGQSGGVATSSDGGLTWTKQSTPGESLYGATFGEGGAIVASHGGNNIYRSTDQGQTWTTVASRSSTDNWGLKYNDGYFVLGSGNQNGDGRMYASGNGVSWVNVAMDSGFNNVMRTGIYVASLGRTFAAGLQKRYSNNNPLNVISSSWVGVSGISGTVYDIAWSPDLSLAVCVGSGGIFSSADLITWTSRSTTPMNGILWYDSKFVAVGPSGAILTSLNGINWTVRTSGTSQALYGIAGFADALVATGDGGTILRSSGD